MKAATNAAQLIRSLRQQMGLTQEKLAARLGVTFPTINRWENGHSQPSPLALRQIESLLAQCGAPGRELAAAFLNGRPGPAAGPVSISVSISASVPDPSRPSPD